MNAITISEFRKNIKSFFDKTKDEHEPLIVTRNNGNAVVMDIDDYNVLIDTVYLLSSKKNADRLSESIKNIQSGNFEEKEITL